MSYKYNNTKYDGIYEYKLKSGKKRFLVRFSITINGKLEEIWKQGFNKVSSASAYKKEIERLADEDRFNIFKERNRTLATHWEEFKGIKTRNGNWNKHTLETNLGRMDFWSNKFGNRSLRTLTSEELQNHIDEMYRISDYSQTTMNGFYRVLNQVLKDAMNEKFISKNPLSRVSYIKPGNWKPKEKTLTLNDYKLYMKTAEEILDSDLFLGVYLLSFGLRRGEVYGVKSNAITFYENGLASININWTRTAKYRDGKSVKSESSNRIVSVDQHTAQLLVKQIEKARQIKIRRQKGILHADDFIFINKRTGNPIYIDALNDAMDKVSKVCGIKAHPHMLRHTFATNASALGIDGIMLQNYLGHADIDMTKHYAQGSLESAESVMRMTEKLRRN